MLSRQSLYARRCVRALVQVIEQVPSRSAVRLPMVLGPVSVGMLLLWTILRWERTFLLVCLEQLGVDMWGLTRDLDEMIDRQKAQDARVNPYALACEAQSFHFWRELDHGLEYWLDQTARQAAALGHQYLGTEHLLLAILAEADPALAALLARHGVGYGEVREAVLAALARGTMPTAEEFAPAGVVRQGPPGARWDTPAAGVPHRFGMGILLLMTTMFAVLFAALQLLGARTAVFIVVAVMFTGVGLGQMLLYGGRYPRAASIWVGAALFPIEVIGLWIHFGSPAEGFAALLIVSPLLGAGFGYLAGGLTAGVFFLLEKYVAWAKRRAQRKEDAAQEKDEKEGEGGSQPEGEDLTAADSRRPS